MNRKRYNSTTIWSTLGTGVLMLTLFGACSPKGKMTKPLFMQSKSASIDIPKEEAGVVAEVVNYTNADTIAPDALSSQNPTNLDTSTVYKLNQVTIAAARIKAVPERNGLVNINFRIKVPKTLLSTNFRMKLSPQLASHDSVIKLPIVVLKGEEFLNKQKQDYAKYDAYLNSIIDTTAYDSAFLNRKQIAKDIRSRQKFNWNIYHRQWKMQMAFMAWKNRTEERYALFNTKQEGYRNGLYHEYLFQAQELKIRNNIMQKDTVGIEKRYLKKFKRKAGVLPQYWLQRDLTLKHVPRKYRKLYTSGQTLEDIVNPAMTDQDSIDIAKHRYFYGKIAENETKKRRKKEIFGKMVPYPYEENMQLDSIVTTDSDFIYYYKHVQPVLQGMKSLHLTMKGRVDAIDLSSYVLPKSDTLTYTISSLVQLVDTTLAYREVEQVKGGQTVTVKEERPNYKEGLRLLDNRDYKGALEILDRYEDYNTALCLTGLGYNAQAYHVLMELDSTADVEYLFAMLLCRFFKEDLAVEHLLKACRLNPSKIFRISLDPEIADLVEKHKLQGQLDEIMLKDGL